MGFGDTSASTETSAHYPGACYYYNRNSLWFNYQFDSTDCSYYNQCFCMSTCEAGTFSDAQGSCVPCPSGKYNSEVGKSSCKNCAKGQSSAAVRQTSDTACVGCTSGRYADAPGLSFCKSCPAGRKMAMHITNSSESSQCVGCDGGRWNDQEAHVGECKICDAGKYSQAGATECSLCSAGMYLSTAGTIGPCTNCELGRFANASGASACMPCTAGLSSEGGNRQSCPSCPPGQFQDQKLSAS